MKKVNLGIVAVLLSMLSCFGQKQKDTPMSYQDDLSFIRKNDNDTLKLLAKNKLHTPIEIYFTAKKTQKEVGSFLLKPKDSLVLISYHGHLSDTTFFARFLDSIHIGYSFGHHAVTKPDKDYLYRLPFKKGKKYTVSQGPNGKFTHNSTLSRYAIDFEMAVGEPVYAAREGTVVKVVDWFTKQGGKELVNAANRIIILHADGTFANYVHLDYNGSVVKEGDYVERGQKIGVSGFTGFTRGPHLHFVVRKERNSSIPIYFEGYEGKMLIEGKRYKAY